MTLVAYSFFMPVISQTNTYSRVEGANLFGCGYSPLSRWFISSVVQKEAFGDNSSLPSRNVDK